MLSYTIKKENPTEGDISKARFSGTRLVQEKRWHIGQNVPLLPEGFVVTEVQADGDELEYLLDNFGNLPMAKTQVISWFGDMAMFIIHNMPIGMTWDKNNHRTIPLRLSCSLNASVVIAKCIFNQKLITLLTGKRKSKKLKPNMLSNMLKLFLASMTEEELTIKYGNLSIKHHEVVKSIANSHNPSFHKREVRLLKEALQEHKTAWDVFDRQMMVVYVDSLIDNLDVICKLKGIINE